VASFEDITTGVVVLNVGEESKKIDVATSFKNTDEGYIIGFKAKDIGSEEARNPITASKNISFYSKNIEEQRDGLFIADGMIRYDSGSAPAMFKFRAGKMIEGEIVIK
jgi:hypothetical protein